MLLYLLFEAFTTQVYLCHHWTTRLIEASQLSKHYKSGTVEVSALRDFSLSVDSGQRLAIVGKSGSGKSTLLNLMAGLDRPSEGTLSIGGHRLDQMTSNQMANYRGQTIGVVFQAFQLLPQRTALQNVELPLLFSKTPRRERHGLAQHWLEKVGLAKRASHHPYALSGGEQQRVAIARALVHQPKLLLADEPTGNLDSASAHQVEDLMLELCRESNITFVLVTHDPGLAERCSDRLIRMSDGQMVED